jgi:hypothetical protein
MPNEEQSTVDQIAHYGYGVYDGDEPDSHEESQWDDAAYETDGAEEDEAEYTEVVEEEPLEVFQPEGFRHKKLLFTAIFMVMAVAGVWQWDISGQAALDQAMQDARLGDQPLTYAEIEQQLPAWEGSQNAALAFEPLVASLLFLHDQKTFNHLPLFRASTAGPAWPLGKPLTGDDVHYVRSVLDNYPTVMASIDRLADYPGGRFDLDWNGNPLEIAETRFEHLSAMRIAAKLQALKALDDVVKGDRQRVVRDVQAMRTICSLGASEPILISQLLATACEAFTADTVQRICSQAQLSPDQLRSLQTVIESMQEEHPLHLAMLGERAKYVALIDYVEADGAQASESLAEAQIPVLPALPAIRGVLQRDYAAGLALLNQQVEAARRPAAQALASIAKLEAEKCGLPESPGFAKAAAPKLDRALTAMLRSHAEVVAAATALAAERYRVEKGRWPSSLGELVPSYVNTLPADPFTGDPLKISRNDRGWLVIYSVGDDNTDDGGRVKHVPGVAEPSDWGFVLLPVDQRGR